MMTYKYPEWWASPDVFYEKFEREPRAVQEKTKARRKNHTTAIQRGLAKNEKEARTRFSTLLKVLQKETMQGMDAPSSTKYQLKAAPYGDIHPADIITLVENQRENTYSLQGKPHNVVYPPVPLAQFWYAMLGKPWYQEGATDVH